MTHDDAFLQAIIENPDDDAPRLLYADWLEEHGQGYRAEFIRVQFELTRMAVFNDRRRHLQARQHHLLNMHGNAWLLQEWPQAANATVNACTFGRGFVAVLSLCGREMGDAGVRALAAAPRLSLLAALDLRKNRIDSGGLRSLAVSPHVIGLNFLDLRENLFTSDWVRVLADSPYLAQLRELVVGRGLLNEAWRAFHWRGSRDVAIHAGALD